MPPAARVGDLHTCPLVSGTVPHVGGPILPAGCPTVSIGFLPAARAGDAAVCAGPPDVIAAGSPTVIVGGQMAARLGDLTQHGGVVAAGCPTVIIGDVGAGAPFGLVGLALAAAAVTANPGDTPQATALADAAAECAALVEKCPYADH